MLAPVHGFGGTLNSSSILIRIYRNRGTHGECHQIQDIKRRSTLSREVSQAGWNADRQAWVQEKNRCGDWAAEHVTIAKATNSYVDPEGGKRLVGDLYEQWLKEKWPFWKETTRVNATDSWRLYCEERWTDRRIGRWFSAFCDI